MTSADRRQPDGPFLLPSPPPPTSSLSVSVSAFRIKNLMAVLPPSLPEKFSLCLDQPEWVSARFHTVASGGLNRGIFVCLIPLLFIWPGWQQSSLAYAIALGSYLIFPSSASRHKVGAQRTKIIDRGLPGCEPQSNPLFSSGRNARRKTLLLSSVWNSTERERAKSITCILRGLLRTSISKFIAPPHRLFYIWV